MEFGNELQVHILDVLRYTREKGKYHTNKRNICALSFRLSADDRITYKTGKLHAKTGDVLLFPNHVAYDMESQDCDMLVVHFHALHFVSDEIVMLTPGCPWEYEELFWKLLHIWQEKNAGYYYEALSIVYQILARMQKELQTVGKRDVYTLAAEEIKRNVGNPDFSISQLCRQAGVCEAMFRRKFKERYGRSPKAYLEKERMDYAILLLEAGVFTHEEIGQKCGYREVKYFRTAFRKKTGVCISQYRKLQI